MKLVTVLNTFQPMEAQLIRSRLEAAGFHPEVVNELSAMSIEGYSVATGGIQVKVPEFELGDVKELLDAEK